MAGELTDEVIQTVEESQNVILEEWGDATVVFAVGPEKYNTTGSFDNDLEIWERQPEEPAASWMFLEKYREIAPQIRSLMRVYREFNPTAHSLPWYVRAYSERWRWQERAVAYDRWATLQEEARLADRKAHARLRASELGQMLREAAIEALGATEIVTKIMNADGTIKQQHSNVGLALIARMAEVGVKIERQSLGLDEEGDRGPSTVVNNLIIQQGGATGDDLLLERASEVLEARQQQARIVDVTPS